MTVSTSSTIWVGPSPSTIGPLSQIDANAIAGIGHADARHRRAERQVEAGLEPFATGRARRARVSGSNTSSAMTTPTTDDGKPAAATPDSIDGDSTLASPTTPTRATVNSARL